MLKSVTTSPPCEADTQLSPLRPDWGTVMTTQIWVDHTTDIAADRDQQGGGGAEYTIVKIGNLRIYLGDEDFLRLCQAANQARKAAR